MELIELRKEIERLQELQTMTEDATIRRFCKLEVRGIKKVVESIDELRLNSSGGELQLVNVLWGDDRTEWKKIKELLKIT